MENRYIGTSGFSYKGWREKFYPADLPEKQQLEFYSGHFNTVEINNSFYRLPKRAVFEGWKKRTPSEFRFAIKGGRYITQMLKLKDTAEAVDNFFTNADVLKTKLAVVLWQLPANFRANGERLEEFARVLRSHKVGKKTRHAFEFRHQSWFTEDVYRILRKHNFALVIAHSEKWPVAEQVTADFLYFRFHGAPHLYASSYSKKALEQWAGKAKKMASGRDLYAYFNNDARGYAVTNAQRFRKMLLA